MSNMLSRITAHEFHCAAILSQAHPGGGRNVKLVGETISARNRFEAKGEFFENITRENPGFAVEQLVSWCNAETVPKNEEREHDSDSASEPDSPSCN